MRERRASRFPKMLDLFLSRRTTSSGNISYTRRELLIRNSTTPALDIYATHMVYLHLHSYLNTITPMHFERFCLFGFFKKGKKEKERGVRGEMRLLALTVESASPVCLILVEVVVVEKQEYCYITTAHTLHSATLLLFYWLHICFTVSSE